MKIFFSILIAVFVFSLSVVAQVYADESLSLGGKLFIEDYVPRKNILKDEPLQLSESAWFNVDSHMSDQSSAHSELAFNHFEKTLKTDVDSNNSTWNLREIYFKQKGKTYWFMAGKVITPWGKSDGYNPTDYLTAKDNTFFNSDDELKRIGSVMLQHHYALSSAFELTSVVTLSPAVTTVLVKKDLLPSGVTLADTEKPTASLRNAEQAIKLDYTASSWDFSLSAFRGFQHTPEYSLTSASTSQILITPKLQRIKAIGADMSVTLDSWILRNENAFTWTENSNATNMIRQPNHLDSVFGFEHPFLDNFRLLTQGIFKYFPKHKADDTSVQGANALETATLLSLQKANTLLTNSQDRFATFGTCRLSYTTTDQIFEAEGQIIIDLNEGDFLARPKINYAVSDQLRTILGADLHYGSKNRPLGSLKDYDAIFAEAKYTF